MLGNVKVRACIHREALTRSLRNLRRQCKGAEFVDFVEAVQGAEAKGEISDSLCQTQTI